MTRQQTNLQILEELKKYILKYPSIRFGQLIFDVATPPEFITMGDMYNPESEVFLKEILKNNPKYKIKDA